MFVDRLINDPPIPLLEKVLEFTDARQTLIADNVANVSTPNYRQKDLSFEGFQKMLREKLDRGGSLDEVSAEIEHPQTGILSHDGNNRSMEQMMSDNAQNALTHNMAIEMLRSQYQTLNEALKERVS